MPTRYDEADLAGLKRVSIDERGGLVDVESFVYPYDPGPELDRLLGVVPDLFAGADFRMAVREISRAAGEGRKTLVMFGAHVIKCGLSRLLIDLMERKVVSAVAMNGACAIHDFEIAMWGRTSEDVALRLEDGSFGMCSETADVMNEAAVEGSREGLGLGECLGRALVDGSAPHLDASVLGRAYELGVPATVHVAIGTDIVHEHPSADGAAIGDTSLRDFRILAEVVAGLSRGAVINVGSAVVLPEVFLKALAVARNLGAGQEGFLALGLDMNEPYRAMVNVVERPTAERGMGIALRGRHELTLPLLWAAVRRALAEQAGRG